MAQRLFNQTTGDLISEICNNNFTELYTNFRAGVPWFNSIKLTAAVAATAVHLVPVALVPAGKKIFLGGFRLNVNGGTAWTDATATLVKIQDTNGSPVVGISFPKALLTANKIIDSLATATLTIDNAILQNTGFTAGKGLDLLGDANFAAGSDIYVTAWGVIL